MTDVDDVLGTGVRCGLFALAALLAGYLVTCLFMSALADGRVDYCRVRLHSESRLWSPIYLVEGHRNWRMDIDIATATSAEEAETKRKAMCPQ